MLTRIQIRAEGPTAHEVEGELRWAAARLISDFGLTGELTEQVIEGTPDKSFSGRLSIVVRDQDVEVTMVTKAGAVRLGYRSQL